jgi:electron transport complex protein RnfG
MSDSVKMVVVLTIVGLLSGGFLTFVYQQTVPEIENKAQQSLRRAIFVVLPEAVDYKELKLEEEVIYQGIDKRGKKAGLAFLAAGSGFQGEIKVMIGMDQDLNKIQYIQVLESVETPGLGGRIAEDDFQEQFEGATVKEKIELFTGPKPKCVDTISQATPGIQTRVQAITGATISSKAVVDIINRKIAIIKKVVQERK